MITVMIGSLLTIASAAQLKLRISPVDNDTFSVSHQFRSDFRSRQELFSYVQQLPSIMQAKGYLAASVDSVEERDTIIIVHLFAGKQYRWRSINVYEQDKMLLNELGYSNFELSDVSFISALPKKIVDHYQDNGYPFAMVKWDSIHLNNNEITATLKIDKGPLYQMDSISVQGPAKISRHFLVRHLGLPEDGIYKRSVLDKIDQKLLELPYAEQQQPWTISMRTTGYVLNFYLQPKRSNQVDALIGFLPSSQQNNGKLLLTVDANVLLRNAFGNGETIDFNWEQIQPKSPRLHLNFQQPYIFRSQFGTDLTFQLYKKDSSFLNITAGLGVQYVLSDRQSAGVSFLLQRTNLLDIDTTSIKFSKQLPDIADMSTVGMGLQYSFNNTNYRFNPRRGTAVVLSSAVSKKTIRRNNAISQIKDGAFNYNSLYDSLDLDSYQLRLRLDAAHYIPIKKRSVLKTALNAGLLQTPDYFRNEMFQLGGYRLLRGFDEESIFTNRFAVITMEYRYLIGLNSFLFGFSDLGYAQFKNEYSTSSNTFIGLGAGMAVETKQGIFNISFAAGKRDDVKFNLRQSKIHLGYTSFF